MRAGAITLGVVAGIVIAIAALKPGAPPENATPGAGSVSQQQTPPRALNSEGAPPAASRAAVALADPALAQDEPLSASPSL